MGLYQSVSAEKQSLATLKISYSMPFQLFEKVYKLIGCNPIGHSVAHTINILEVNEWTDEEMLEFLTYLLIEEKKAQNHEQMQCIQNYIHEYEFAFIHAEDSDASDDSIVPYCEIDMNEGEQLMFTEAQYQHLIQNFRDIDECISDRYMATISRPSQSIIST